MALDESTAPETPELDKLHEAEADLKTISAFLDWLDSKHLTICYQATDVLRCTELPTNQQDLLYSYFGLDGSKCLAESEAVLVWARECRKRENNALLE